MRGRTKTRCATQRGNKVNRKNQIKKEKKRKEKIITKVIGRLARQANNFDCNQEQKNLKCRNLISMAT